MTRKTLIFDGPPEAAWTLVLAHGAGQNMRSPFMNAFAEGLTERGDRIGGLQVARFEFPYMASGKKSPPDREPVLLDCWRGMIQTVNEDCPRERLLIGGKSLGGRIASMIADEQGVAGLVCLGYPFHPPGKPEKTRTAHLQTLTTPALICQGTRDPFGTREDVANYQLADSICIHWLEDGDHGFKPRKASGLSEADNWHSAMGAIVAFIGGLHPMPLRPKTA